MTEVRVGTGNLAGKGVYAGRDFVAGEAVVVFELEGLDEAQYLALPADDHMFVHSYGGRRYLYPPPARFVNHADDPSCFQDFEQCCHVAVRDISEGEPITIDATQETERELTTFLDAYTRAQRSRSVADLGSLIDSGVTSWRLGAAVRGREALVSAVLESDPATPDKVEWLVGTGRWEATGSISTGSSNDHSHITLLLRVIRGNWQLVYEHVG